MRRWFVLIPLVFLAVLLAGCSPDPAEIVVNFNRSIDLERPNTARSFLTKDAASSWGKGDLPSRFSLDLGSLEVTGVVEGKSPKELTVKAEMKESGGHTSQRYHYLMKLEPGGWKIAEVRARDYFGGGWQTVGEEADSPSQDRAQTYSVPDRKPDAVGGPGKSPEGSWTTIANDISIRVIDIRRVAQLTEDVPAEFARTIQGDFLVVNLWVRNDTRIPRQVFYANSFPQGGAFGKTQFLLRRWDTIYGNTVDTEEFTIPSSSVDETLNPYLTAEVNVAFRIPDQDDRFHLIVKGWGDDHFIDYYLAQ